MNVDAGSEESCSGAVTADEHLGWSSAGGEEGKDVQISRGWNPQNLLCMSDKEDRVCTILEAGQIFIPLPSNRESISNWVVAG